VGKKLSLTGNGRCNITNKDINLSRYHGDDVEFCRYALEKYDRVFCENFFSEIGVPFVFEGDKGYPASLQASSVVDCLRFAADALGVITHTDTKVTNIMLSGGNYKVISDKVSFMAKNVIIATGLYSGGDRMGCDGSMLSILKKAGYKTVKTTPAIVQLKTETDIVKQLKGIKVNANVTLRSGNKVIREEYGETLFCDYGLSGPPVLQLSRETARNESSYEISLDIMPDVDLDTLYESLFKRATEVSYLNFDEFFTGMLNKRLGQVILKLAGCKLSDSVKTLNADKLRKIASNIKNFSFKVTGNTGFTNSQVTAGGLKTSQFNSKTMMSNLNHGLFAVGEILDIDGDCGGFNLQWAWSSAMCAVDAIIGSGKL
jgi:predicted Rossmann fold flavoprotein